MAGAAQIAATIEGTTPRGQAPARQPQGPDVARHPCQLPPRPVRDDGSDPGQARATSRGGCPTVRHTAGTNTPSATPESATPPALPVSCWHHPAMKLKGATLSSGGAATTGFPRADAVRPPPRCAQRRGGRRFTASTKDPSGL